MIETQEGVRHLGASTDHGDAYKKEHQIRW